MNPPVRVTAAEWWELQARRQEVEAAKLRVGLAELALVEAQRRVLAAHGVELGTDVELVREGATEGQEAAPR